MSWPRAVIVLPHDPDWADRAQNEIARITSAAGPWLTVHHIGSTAVPGLAAKPILDLLAAAPDLATLETARPALERLGYRWRGENGIAGRRYWTLDGPLTGMRAVHFHGFAAGDPAVARHLAFRDHWRAYPDIARDYAALKLKCAALHPYDGEAYSDCKNDWIVRTEREALCVRSQS